MDRASLEELGLRVRDGEDDVVLEAELVFPGSILINPLTRQTIDRVVFTIMGDRLLYVAPPEFVGGPPINLAFVTSANHLQDVVVQTLGDHLFQLERRSNELSAMGVPPKVDPMTLQLTAEVSRGPFHFTLGASRSGQFRVTRCVRDDTELTSAGQTQFELSEFRSRHALADYLFAMFCDVAVSPQLPPPELLELGVTVAQLARAFGDGTIPPRESIEVVAELKVGTERLRFVASRLKGRTFRGLLAGPRGKIWAERFEIEAFPGIRPLVARLLKVTVEHVEVVG
ncbi:MAG: hypothetical protein JNG84_00605 [Archangium sp.]|nr:hypothetical protein [Archangium sp.]